MKRFGVLMVLLLPLLYYTYGRENSLHGMVRQEEGNTANAPDDSICSLLIMPAYEVHDAVPCATDPLATKATSGGSFEDIIAKVPITPLPFGVKNLDEMSYCLPPWSKLDAPIEYDRDNSYGLNSYFYDHELDPFVDHEGRSMPDQSQGGTAYFSKRLPDLPTGEKVLLYYYTKPNGLQKWMLVVCEPSGRIVYSENSILSADNYMRLSYIDESYYIRIKHFKAIESRPLKSDRTPNGEVDEVCNAAKEAKLTILFHETFYKLQKPQNDDHYTPSGRWHEPGDSASYIALYRWIDGKATKVETRRLY